MSTETLSLFDSYVIPSYGRLPLTFVRGEGAWLTEENGDKYLDMYPGWGVNIIGHCHPEVVAAIQTQAGQLLHVPNNYHNPLQGALARDIVTRAFPGKVFFGNSGAEANEGAMKLARRWGNDKGKWKIVTTLNSFHGRTFATLSATGQEKYHTGFGPMLPGFSHIPFGDIEAAKAAIDEETGAFMVEPIQGEGGINVAPENYFTELRALCDERNCLLIFDEVQTGVGRTGEWFGCQYVGVTPDVMTLAKALGGGVPIGAFVAAERVADVLQPGTHASTYGGNPLVCAAALAVINVIEEKDGLTHAQELQKSFRARCADLQTKFACIKDVRGAGTMLGIELDVPGMPVVQECMKEKVLINCTHENVLRFLTTIFLTEKEIDISFNALEKAVGKL